MRTHQLQFGQDDYFPFGFPISRKAWNNYRASDALATEGGGSRTLYALRGLADRMNAARAPHAEPIHAGQLAAMGLLTEVLRYLVDRYCVHDYAGALLRGLEATRAAHGAETVERPPHAFIRLYPPREASPTPAAYLDGKTRDLPNRYVASREMVMLKLTTENRALSPFAGLYDDADLKRESPYDSLMASLETYFRTLPPFIGFPETLLDFLRAPMRACPESLEGQLAYVMQHWAALLPPDLLQRLALAADIMHEESRMRGHGPGPAHVLRFGPANLLDWGYAEPAAFTYDRDWMANVVLIAKSVHVWLDQLSTQYQRPVTRLDEVPDEELDRLARWGFTGVWLIGVWERSSASQRIKQMTGNPEALSSAYSLWDYVIANDLGGEAAFDQLRNRAWRRGIRLASDMVPNHVGLYSRWIIEHPDWFIHLDYPPFPSYRFTGPDFSSDPRVSLYIEDGYWERRDAGVVFKRVDNGTGSVRYIYHGNDGTNMPWNDTAQLNFLLPEVREAVIRTILHVARSFPIIRFDAAMTLAKRHYQRLWFPKPGDAGAVPSRAEFGMSRPEFDAVFPKEFWREVVDRIQIEAPDTLLLAEAFWLMEGYFVRTLGMHRVYNSAFMNMLKMEENANYRMTVKNVLEFTPEVLKRFVNFMSNPDEMTAVDQFGRDDKYYGVAVMMVTMPGLPMFGHGQIEGFTERYGMEYPRAYWNEQVDEHMVRRHETEIFPLMRKRRLFSGAEHFALYDFVTPDGWVDENVFAYSNRTDGDRALILYNNAFTTTRGRIHLSTAINVGDADNKELRRRTLAEALALDVREDRYYVFRDHRTGLEYLRAAAHVAREGLAFELQPYEYFAFLDFREILDTDGTWSRLAATLGDRGVPSIDEARREMLLEPIHAPFRGVMNADMLRALAGPPSDDVRMEFEAAMTCFLSAASKYTTREINVPELVDKTRLEIDVLHELPARLKRARLPKKISQYLLTPIPEDRHARLAFWRISIACAITRQITQARRSADYSLEAASDVDEWLLAKIAAEAFEQFGGDAAANRMDALLIKILAGYPMALDFAAHSGGAFTIRKMFHDPAVQRFLLMNQHQGVLWLNKEQTERMIYWLFFEAVVSLIAESRLAKQAVVAHFENAMEILRAVQASGYRVEGTLELLSEPK